MKNINKYKNHKVEGFDSKKERDRYYRLKAMENAGEISELETQVKFELIPSQRINGRVAERACYYVADFVYKDKAGNVHVEDVKGFKTETYKLKRKLLLWTKNIKIEEV